MPCPKYLFVHVLDVGRSHPLHGVQMLEYMADPTHPETLRWVARPGHTSRGDGGDFPVAILTSLELGEGFIFTIVFGSAAAPTHCTFRRDWAKSKSGLKPCPDSPCGHYSFLEMYSVVKGKKTKVKTENKDDPPSVRIRVVNGGKVVSPSVAWADCGCSKKRS